MIFTMSLARTGTLLLVSAAALFFATGSAHAQQSGDLTKAPDLKAQRAAAEAERMTREVAAKKADADRRRLEVEAVKSGVLELERVAGELARVAGELESATGEFERVKGLPVDPEAAFDYASGLLLSSDYERAKVAFSHYLEAFPNQPHTPVAQFRLGEIHLLLGENAAAADDFIAHIRNYPNDPRAADAFLKLGTAFARLDRSKEACIVFKTMKARHPKAPSAVVQRAELEKARIGCE